MELEKSILKDIRESIGVGADNTAFDTELIQHINTAISKLNQNGVGKFIVVKNDESTWGDLQNPDQTEGNKFFQMVPLFISLSTKLLFDPPPPSNVEYHSRNAQEILWRLKIEYENLNGSGGEQFNA